MNSGSGAYESMIGRDPSIIAYSWLSEAPWALVVKQPMHIAYAKMVYARNILISASFVLLGAIFIVIWVTTTRFFSTVQHTAEEKGELQSQLIHAAKLVSVGELAAGVAHEINNPLQIIAAESGVIRDLLNPEFQMKHPPEKIIDELQVIDEAVFRAKDITQKLLSFARRSAPRILPCNLNDILSLVVDGFVEKKPWRWPELIQLT
jgi:two-component system, NtrC family, sensor kinase